MMRHILLLRGVNVGGSHIVNMKELCGYLTEAGFARAAHYINSGNLLTEGGQSREGALSMARAALSRYGFPIPFALIAFEDYAAENEGLPAWWRAGPAFRRNVLFYLDSFEHEKAQKYLCAHLLRGERVHVGKLALFWQVDGEKAYSASRYHHLMEAPFYRDITIRNANTFGKLLALSEKF